MKIFQNLFKPKWKNKDPEIRKQALISLNKHENQDVFTDVAKNDPVSEIRQLAIKRLINLDIINEIALSDSESKVRELANKILCQMLSGEIEGNLNSEQRLEKIKLLENQTVLEHIAQKGDSARLRMTAVEKITRESLLGNLAINDDDAEIRLTAANKLSQKSTLERVFRSTKTKDKIISKITRKKLDAIIAEEERPARLLEEQKQICITMESLGNKGLWERDKKQFDSLLTQWQSLEETPVDEFQKRFENAKSRFTKNYNEYLERHAERLKQEEALLPIKEKKQSTITLLHDLYETLSTNPNLTSDELKSLSTNVDEQAKSWKKIGQLPNDIELEFSNQFNDIYNSINKILNTRLKNVNLLSNLTKIKNELDGISKHPKKLKEQTLQNLESRLSSVYVDSSMDEATNLKLTIKNRLDEVRKKLTDNLKEAEQKLSHCRKLLEDLDTALNNGVLKDAIELKKSILQNIQFLEKFQPKGLQTVKNHLTAANTRINELSNWRSWANTPQKEQLIQKIEALIDSHEDPKEIAFIISQARKTWKKLGSSEKETSQQLWEQFQTACEKAYEPCKAYFEEDSKIKQVNYEKRQAFLDDLESFIRNADWATVDWKKTENLYRHLKNEWQSLGQTETEQRKSLNKKFYNLHEELRTHIHNEWDKNLATKQSLIEQARQLENIEDLNEAISQAKTLQSAWKKAGRIAQSNERELWKALKAECDKVFSRKQDAIKQQESELAEKIVAKEKICSEIELLCNKPLNEFATEKNQLHILQQQFEDAGTTNKNKDEKLRQRIAVALHIYERKLESLEKLQTLTALKHLRKKSELLDQWEAQLEKGNEIELNTIRETFANTEMVSEADWQEKIGRRFDSLNTIQQSTNRSVIFKQHADKNIEDKNLATIHLEIIANIETPAEASEDRLKLQAQRLSEKLQHHEEENIWEAFLAAEAKWLTTGPIENATLQNLSNRRIKALEALQKEFPEELENYL